MKTLLPSGILLLLLLSVFYQCRSTIPEMAFPNAILSYTDTLPKYARPVKMLVDQNGHIYWLSFVGDLHVIRQDGSEHQDLNRTHMAWRDVTFIEDFCMNGDKIYFTDLMDLQTGQSAIKMTDIEGKKVEVIAYLTHEIPYYLSLFESQQTLFYLSKTDTDGRPHFRLRFLDLEEGTRGTLYSSLSKIDSLYYDEMTQKINIHNTRQEQFAFSTNLESMRILAEAFRP